MQKLYLSTKSLYSPLQLGWGSGSGGGVGHGRMRMERGRKKRSCRRDKQLNLIGQIFRVHYKQNTTTSFWALTIRKVGLDIGSNLNLPLITVRQELFFVVEQLFVCLCGKLEVRSFNNRIDGAGFLTKAAGGQKRIRTTFNS